MAFIFVTIILLSLVIGLFYLYLTWNFNFWKKRGINGPKPKLFFGTQPNAVTQKHSVVIDIAEHYNKYKGKERFIGTFLIRTPQLMILTPDLAKEVFVSKFRNFQDNHFSTIFDSSTEPIFALNPFLLKGQEWKDKRAEISPALTINRVKASYPVIQKVCSQMIDFIKDKIEAEGTDYDFDCRDLTQRYTIQNVADCIYGVKAEAFEINKDSELLGQAKSLLQGLFQSFGTLLLMSAVPFLSTIYKIRFISPETKHFFSKLMQDAIKLRKAAHQTDRVDFLNYIMQLKERKGLSNIELQALSITFFLDGYETSATLIAHVLLCLGRNRDIQNKLREELQKTADVDGYISFEKLTENTYLDMCVNETLRMYPSASFSQKTCTEDTEFSNFDGNVYKIKKGMSVIIPTYCFHNDEEYFPNPSKYDPERFNPESGGDKKYKEIGCFAPFGDGPRTCLGQKFGLTQVKTAVCELVRNFEIILSDKTRTDEYFDPKIFISVVYLDGGIWCKFKELQK